MAEDLSLKHSPNIVDIVNVEDAVRTVELDYTDLCGMDTLIRIDEDVQMLSCKHCIFQDMSIDDDEVVCPLKIIGEFFLVK